MPDGPFLYGDEREERTIAERFWIARYPVTNGQYRRFVEDGGYRREELWSDEGWKWRSKQGLDGPRAQSEDYENPIFPRINVTFYEAEAYCGWLSAIAKAFRVAGREQPLAAAGLQVRLPSEEEWERAARGIEGRKYPWGDEFEMERANTEESDLERKVGLGAMAVCTFPRASPRLAPGT